MKPSTSRLVRLVRCGEALDEAMSEAVQLAQLAGQYGLIGPGTGSDANRVRLISALRKEIDAELAQITSRAQEKNGAEASKGDCQ